MAILRRIDILPSLRGKNLDAQLSRVLRRESPHTSRPPHFLEGLISGNMSRLESVKNSFRPDCTIYPLIDMKPFMVYDTINADSAGA